MQSGKTVSIRYAKALLRAATTDGGDAKELCRAVSLSPARLDDHDERISAELYFALWAVVMEWAGDPNLPLRAAKLDAGDNDVLRFMAMTSPNLSEALRRMSRYISIATDAIRFTLSEGRKLGSLTFTRPMRVVPGMSSADEYVLAQIVNASRMITGVQLSPVEVRFSWGEQGQSSALRAFFQAPLRFGCSPPGLVFDSKTLALPMLKSDPELLAFFERHVEAALRGRGEGSDLLRIKKALTESLREGVPTLERVAKLLATTPRTLRRRLQSQGNHFQALLDDTRSTLARHYLDEGMAVTEVALLLGFSEASAFHRAFRRWTGTTPHGYRRGAAIEKK